MGLLAVERKGLSFVPSSISLLAASTPPLITFGLPSDVNSVLNLCDNLDPDYRARNHSVFGKGGSEIEAKDLGAGNVEWVLTITGGHFSPAKETA